METDFPQSGPLPAWVVLAQTLNSPGQDLSACAVAYRIFWDLEEKEEKWRVNPRDIGTLDWKAQQWEQPLYYQLFVKCYQKPKEIEIQEKAVDDYIKLYTI